MPAFTFVDRGDSTTAGTVHTFAAMTPVSGQVCYILVGFRRLSGTAAAPALTGTNGWNVTWTKIDERNTTGSTLQGAALYRGIPSSGTAGVFTATFANSHTQCLIDIVTATGVDTATNEGVVQSGNGSGTTSGALALDAPLSAFGDVNNATLLAGIAIGSPSGFTAESGSWGSDVITGNPMGGATAWLTGNDTTPTGTLTSGTRWVAIAIEIKATTGGSSATPAVGAVALTGIAPALFLAISLTVGAGSLTLAGVAPTVQTSNPGERQPTAGAIALTGVAPTVSLSSSTTKTPTTGALSLTGAAGSLRAPLTLGTGAITLTGLAPALVSSAAPSGYATRDLASLATPYRARIVGEPVITRRLVDTQWGLVEVADVTVELANVDGAITVTPAQLRGRSLVVKRYDDSTSYTLTEGTFRITSATRTRTRVIVRGSNFNRALLEQDMPEPTVETVDWPNAVDVGTVIAVIVGSVPKLPLLYVNDDIAGSEFDYLVGHGTCVITALHRNAPGSESDRLISVGFGECTRAAGGPATSWSEVARTDLYPGYTVVRFILRQGIGANVSGGLHTLYADVTGLTPERNPARLIRTMLAGGLAWSLGETVNAASFDAAEALIPTTLVLDGAMRETRPAQAWLRELCMMRGLRLGINAAGEWTLSVDTQANSIRLRASDDRHTLFDAAVDGVADEDLCRKRVVRYREDFIGKRMAFKIRRVVNATSGRNRPVTLKLVRDHTAADLINYYLAQSDKDTEDRVRLELPQEARALTEGDTVELTETRIGYTDTVLMVSGVEKALTRITATAFPKWWGTYFYTPGALPADAITGTADDLSRTTPSAGTLTFLSNQTDVGGDGHVLAKLRYDVTLPTTNILDAVMLYKLAGGVEWAIGAILTPGATRARVNGLLPGTSYDFGLQVRNPFGLVSAIVTDLARVTATDATVPSTPSAPTVTNPKPGTHLVIDTSTPPLDWAYTICYRDTNSGFAGAVEIQRGKQRWFLDQSGVYGTNYWYFLQHVDQSGNASSASTGGTSGAGAAKVVVGDLEDNAVEQAKIANSAVATAKIATDAVTQITTDYDSSTDSMSSTTVADISSRTVTLTVSSTSSSVLITFSMSLGLVNDHVTNGQVCLGRVTLCRADNTVLIENVAEVWLDKVGGVFSRTIIPMTLTYVDSGVSGSQTYKLRWRCGTASTTLNLLSYPTMQQALEIKR